MIIDTMVMGYAILNEPTFGKEAAEALRLTKRRIAPVSIEAELLSVIWQYIVQGMDRSIALTSFDIAANMWTELIPVSRLWSDALDLALARGHSPYDTLFVAAARLRRTRVLTYDKKVLKLFPEYAVSVQEFLA